MLSVLLMEQDDAFAHLLKFYVPQAKTVFDMTYGKGTLVRNLLDISVYGIDLKPNPLPCHIIEKADISTYEPRSRYDAILFDPPYLYGKDSYKLYAFKDPDWQAQHSNAFTPLDFTSLCNSGAVLASKLGTICFCKVMNSRLKGEYIDNATILKSTFVNNGWRVCDVLVYVRLGVGVFRNTKTAQVAHGFWYVFKREDVS